MDEGETKCQKIGVRILANGEGILIWDKNGLKPMVGFALRAFARERIGAHESGVSLQDRKMSRLS
jgi:hypothetical protein